MNIFISYFILSCLILVFIILFSKYCYSLNLIDRPNDRKLHIGEVPLVGGLSIYCALFLSLFFFETDLWIKVIVLSASIVVLLGALDDAIQLGVPTRIVSQFIAPLIVIGSNLSIVNIGSYFNFPIIELGMFGLMLTFISMVGLINAVNFMDGLDGLCSGLTIISLISLIIFSFLNNNTIHNDILNLLIILIFIFFFINIGFTPIKKVFLGDAGSTLLGFLIASFLIYYSHPSINKIHPL